MGRIKKMTPVERERLMSILQVPPDTALPDRLIKVIQYTSLSFRGLLEKWLHQEEASTEAAKLAREEIPTLHTEEPKIYAATIGIS
jgi:hypothetical protein